MLTDQDEIIKIQQEFEDALIKIRQISPKFAEASAQFKNLKALEKTEFARCYQKAPGKTQKDKEMFALASPEYETYLKGLNEAQEKYIKIKVSYDVQKARFDHAQSLLSFHKSLVSLK